MCIIIICFPVYEVLNFEISLTFLSSCFFVSPKKSVQKFKDWYPKNETSFKLNLKAFFIFKGLSVAKLFRSVSLNTNHESESPTDIS